ncbi:ABC transporter ATP-binding protein [Vibrio sinaloensis]|uniref:ABC transporter ATP-binding protein n=1 Tax=Photobacterium sp. (strain ATCC 43367) TaxID=379097 RepID=UPI0035E86395
MARPSGLKQSLPSLLKFVRHTKPYLNEKEWLIGSAFGFLILQAFVRMLEPWPLKYIVDRLVVNDPTSAVHFAAFAQLSPIHYIFTFSLILIALVAIRAVVTYMATISMAVAGNHVITRLREKLFSHMQGLSILYHQKQRSGDLIIRLIGDMGMIKEVAVTAVVPLISSGLIFTLILSAMLWLNWQLALIALLPLPILWLVTIKKSKKIHTVAKKNRQREGDMAATAAESIGAIQSVQALKIEDRFGNIFRQANSKSLKEGVKGKKLVASLQRTVEILVAISTALVLTFGSLEVLAGHLTPGGLLVFVYYLRRVFRPIRDFTKYTARLAKASAAGERVLKVLDEEHMVRDHPDAQTCPILTGDIVFSNVRFHYPDKKRSAIHDINVTISHGRRLALVGASGSGKSTLISLLLRLCEPSQGTITINHTPIERYTIDSYRNQFAVVMQDTALFSATIAENISVVVPDASQEQIVAAAKVANIDDYIQSLPKGYQTEIGERGVTLSSGQKQRIAIARAALKNTPILILDEPTTGLDPEAEALVSKALVTLSTNKTTIWITHRPKFADMCDVVVRLNHGSIVDTSSQDSAALTQDIKTAG